MPTRSRNRQAIISKPFSKFCYEYAFMALIKGEMTSNRWLLRGILIPDEDWKSDTGKKVEKACGIKRLCPAEPAEPD